MIREQRMGLTVVATAPESKTISPARRRRTQTDQRRAPAAEFGIVERERHHLGMPHKDGVHRPPQVADAFPVDDADLQDAARLAGGEIVRHEIFHLARLERVQIQHAVNGHLNRLACHAWIEPRLSDLGTIFYRVCFRLRITHTRAPE